MIKGIYFHNPKTAGTSIKKALKLYENKILTESSPCFAGQWKGTLNAQMFDFKFSRADFTKLLIHQEFGPDVWDNIFKFSFVRNPWDRYISNWHWLTRKEKTYPLKGWKARGWKGEDGNISFKNFVEQTEKIYVRGPDGTKPFRQNGVYQHDKWHLWNQIDHLKNKDGIIELDFIGRFENLQEEFDDVCNKLLGEKIRLTHINHVGYYEDQRLIPQPHYSTHYTDELVEIVRQRCLPDIQAFGYEFEWE